ncbi:MAG TPA: hypothetical protein DCE41_00625 [Cytophagales bacterium]|nr:hypothetical protein [Cytophagales bacterium]HAA23603.1 hypothetical protein [Cytophagales bacterium]HAP60740.1 hypothetical protein [Cytophagales bacterium]
MKFVVSADDYGVNPIIDKAIEDAVAKGCITNIAAMANGVSGELEKLKSLKEQYPHISVGCHFTLTSGKALTWDGTSKKPASLVKNKKGRFKDMLGIQPIKIDLVELRAELQAQIKKFEDIGLEIDHFSDHLGILTLMHRTSRVYFEEVMAYNAEYGKQTIVRNPVLTASTVKKGCLKMSEMFRLGRLGGKTKKQVSMNRDAMEGQLEKLQALGLKTTDLFVEHLWEKPEPGVLRCILKKTSRSANPLVKHRANSEPIVEILSHLACPPENVWTDDYRENHHALEDFGGINLLYLKNNRANEYKMLIQELPKYVDDPDIELVSFTQS